MKMKILFQLKWFVRSVCWWIYNKTSLLLLILKNLRLITSTLWHQIQFFMTMEVSEATFFTFREKKIAHDGNKNKATSASDSCRCKMLFSYFSSTLTYSMNENAITFTYWFPMNTKSCLLTITPPAKQTTLPTRNHFQNENKFMCRK